MIIYLLRLTGSLQGLDRYIVFLKAALLDNDFHVNSCLSHGSKYPIQCIWRNINYHGSKLLHHHMYCSDENCRICTLVREAKKRKQMLEREKCLSKIQQKEEICKKDP